MGRVTCHAKQWPTPTSHLPGAFLSIFLIQAWLIHILRAADPTTSLYILKQVEFRRLCQTLHSCLSNVAKYSHQLHCINLSDADTFQRHLDMCFAQLNTSVELKLWQEAFQSVEDVHNLLTMATKAPRPLMMANYYEKLTKIFLMSVNALFCGWLDHLCFRFFKPSIGTVYYSHLHILCCL
jgi:hypothetical protein